MSGVSDLHVVMQADAQLAAELILLSFRAALENVCNGVHPGTAAERVAIPHRPERANGHLQALAQQRANVRQSIELPVLRLSELPADFGEVVPVDRGGKIRTRICGQKQLALESISARERRTGQGIAHAKLGTRTDKQPRRRPTNSTLLITRDQAK